MTCANSVLVLTTVPPHSDLLVISTKTKVELVTEDPQHSESLHDSLARHHCSVGDVDVVLRIVVLQSVCM